MTRGRRLVARLLAAILVPAGLLAALEGAARLALPPLEPRLFQPVETATGVAWQRSPEAPEPWYPPYSKEKPAGLLRVACIGGSTVVGPPFPDRAFPRVLEALLATCRGGAPVEVMSAGVAGQYSQGELAVLGEVLEFQPDVVVLYSCHNEFHRRNVAALLDRRRHPLRAALLDAVASTRLGAEALLRLRGKSAAIVPSAADEAPDHRPVDGPEFPLVVAAFRERLAEFVGACRARGVAVVLCTAVANARDFAPLVDVFRAETAAADRTRVRELLDQAERAVAAGDAATALERAAAAEAIDPTPASVPFQRGRALLLLGRRDEAAAALEQALERDGRLTRGPRALNDAVREVAGAAGAIVADVERAIAAEAPFRIVGYEHVLDNVHPNPDCHRRIAEIVLRALAGAGIGLREDDLARAGEALATGALPAPPSAAEIEARIGQANLLLALESGRFGPSAATALARYERAEALEPGRPDVAIALGVLESLRESSFLARGRFRAALRAGGGAEFRSWAAAARKSPLVLRLFERGGIRFDAEGTAELLEPAPRKGKP